MANITNKQISDILKSENPLFTNILFDESNADKSTTDSPEISFFDFLDNHIEYEFQEIIFTDCEFYISAVFNGLQDFNLIFDGCKFHKDLEISDNRIDTFQFKNSQILNAESTFIIYGNQFQNELLILDSKINSRCNFRGSSNGNCTVERVIFGNILEFNLDITSQKTLLFDSNEFLKPIFFRHMTFWGNTIFRSCDLSNSSFLYSTFENTLFSSCNINVHNLIDEKILNHEYAFIDPDDTEKYATTITYEDIINQYRMFEINFDKHKDFELAGEFHKKRYELQRKHEQNKFKKFVITLYKWFSNYGEDYQRSLLWIIGMLAGFSITYLFTGIKYDEAVIYWGNTANNMYKWYEDLGTAFLYSLNSSVPFRREIEHIKTASGLTTFFSIFQTLLQTIIGTLFIVALRRKFRR